MPQQGEDPAPDASQAFGESRQRARWSWGHRAFVFTLTLTLCVALFALVVIARVRSRAPLCIPNTPALARLAPGELRRLRAELASAMALDGARADTSGYVPADDVWRDDPPEGSSLQLGNDGRGPAGYEIRVWAPDPQWGPAYRDHVVGDAFMFKSTSQAQSFFQTATATRCYRSSLARTAPRPAGARNLIWSNPDAATQEDAFLTRGRDVYRIAVVRPGADTKPTSSAEYAAGVATVNRLACAISAAECLPPNATARFVADAPVQARRAIR